MNRKTAFFPGEYYHLYNRGVDKRVTFTDSDAYKRFQLLLLACNSENPVHINNKHKRNRTKPKSLESFMLNSGNNLVDIGTYCLMPNHFHILVREVSDNGISKFMQKLGTGYTMYFNRKHKRTGSLFESKFKATHASNDTYLRYLFSYIHLNPVKIIEPTWKENGIQDMHKTKTFLQNYKYSGYIDHIGIPRSEQEILNIKTFPSYFKSPTSFKKEINDWLSYKSDS